MTMSVGDSAQVVPSGSDAHPRKPVPALGCFPPATNRAAPLFFALTYNLFSSSLLICVTLFKLPFSLHAHALSIPDDLAKSTVQYDKQLQTIQMILLSKPLAKRSSTAMFFAKWFSWPNLLQSGLSKVTLTLQEDPHELASCKSRTVIFENNLDNPPGSGHLQRGQSGLTKKLQRIKIILMSWPIQ